MRPAELKALLERVRDGATDVGGAVECLSAFPAEDLGFAVLDHQRELRTGMPEAVFAQGKAADQVVAIARRLWEEHGLLLVTRAEPDVAERVCQAVPGARYNALARTVSAGGGEPRGDARVAIVCAGTADLPVAEEVAETLSVLSAPLERVYDVGVAGLHRLTRRLETLRAARAIVVVAGMEGALPSVVAGLVPAPVIGVPTSVGYGASFGGVAALLGMLNSCAAGLAVVNIDNGFGAACIASRIVTGTR
ncbi:MAG: nickel pincer cofactor biosynthesis protein LarB [Gemmatimonadota bacterium]